MNNIPQIIINSGYEVGQDGTLTALIIPNVVATLNAPTKVTFNGATLNYMPSTAAALQEIDAPNVVSLSIPSQFINYKELTTVKFNNLTSIMSTTTGTNVNSGIFMNCIKLVSVYMPSLETITDSGASSGGLFRGCTSLETVSFPELIAITNSSGGAFAACSSLVNISFPKLLTITCGTYSNSYGYTFNGCTGLVNVNLPKLQTTTTHDSTCGVFSGCTSLQNVTLGSIGSPVSSLGNYTFKNCTQSGLTITVYTADGNAIAGSPWGATNATIVWEEA